MNLPSLAGVWLSLGPFPFTALIALAIAVTLWYLMMRQVFRSVRVGLRQPGRRNEENQAVRALGCVGLVVFSIGAFHLYDSVQQLGNAWWWQITPEEIAEIEIVRVPTMNKPPVGPVISLRERTLLRDGFRRLADARFYVRHAEIYQDGYRLRLRKVGEADFSERYLFVYHRSNDKPGCPAVVFDRGLPTPDDEVAHLAGEFLSPAFLQWLDEVVAPRFPAQRP